MSIQRWSRFRPSSGDYLPEIDGLRFVAIMGVIGIHLGGIWITNVGRTYPNMGPIEGFFARLVGIGFYGVELFFIISGFVLALPFLKHALGMGKKVELRKYIGRRLTRLEPPYVLSMLFFFLVYPLVGKGTLTELWPNLLASLLYVHNIVYGTGSVLNNNAWSLEVEVQFYLLVPFILAMVRRSPKARTLVLSSFVVVSSLHTLWLPESFPRSLLQYMQYFGVGILLCELWLVRWHSLKRNMLWDFAGASAAALFVLLYLDSEPVLKHLANPWLMGVFFASVLRGVILSKLLTWSWVPVIGGMCYSIYLLHARVISILLYKLFGHMELTGNFMADYFIMGSVIVPATIVVSAVFYALIERPCMDPAWPGKIINWWSKRRHA